MSQANTAQQEYWNSAVGHSWAEMQARMDVQLAPLGQAALRALAPARGDRVLDIGCGCGATSVALAEAVGTDGRITGVDISAPMLEVARARPQPAGVIDWRLADAQTEPFVPASFDGAYSRFGVMFFEDPQAAFANIRTALRPGGRIAFVCWREAAQNPMFTGTMGVVLKHFPAPEPPPPYAPGPFAFAEPGRAVQLLTAAGFAEASAEPLDCEISPGPVDDALALSLEIGPLGALLRQNSDKRPLVIEDVRADLEKRVRDGAVRYPSATWIVTATAA